MITAARAWAQAGAVDPAYAPLVLNLQVSATPPEVKSVLVRADGKILISGNFNTASGTNRPGLARLNWDGSLDSTFVPVLTGQPFLQPDGKVLINLGSSLRRLNPDGSLDSGFLVTVPTNATIRNLATQPDGRIVLDVTSNGGTDAVLRRVNVDGSPDVSLSRSVHDPIGRGDAVTSLTVQTNGAIVVGGEFLGMGPLSDDVAGLARLNADGSVDSQFISSIPGPVTAVLLQSDQNILAVQGGYAPAQQGLYRINPNGLTDGQFLPAVALTGTAGNQKVALQADGKVLVVDDAPGAELVRLNPDGGLDTGFKAAAIVSAGAGARLDAVAVQADERILIGGLFTGVGGTSRVGLARLNTDGSLDPTFQPQLALVLVSAGATTVSVVVMQPDGKALIGGAFSSINGQGQTNLARLNPDGTLDPTFSAALSGPDTINLLALQSDGRMLIAGNFTNLGGVARNGLARLNADGSLDRSFDAGSGPSPSRGIRTVAVQSDGGVIVGGWFTGFSGWTCFGLVRLTPDGGVDTNFLHGDVVRLENPPNTFGTAGGINSIALDGLDRIIVGGRFQVASGGLFRTALAAFDGSGNLAPSFAPSLLLGSGPGPYPTLLSPYMAWVTALVVDPDNRLLLSGQFDVVDGFDTHGLARLNADGTLDATFNPPSPLTILPPAVVQPDGGIIVNLGQALLRLRPDGSVDPAFSLPRGVTADCSSLVLEPGGLSLLAAGSFSVGSRPASLIRVFTVPPPILSRPTRAASGSLQLTLTGATNHPYRIEVSTNLGDWIPTATITLTNASQAWEAPPPATAFPQFYRAVLLSKGVSSYY